MKKVFIDSSIENQIEWQQNGDHKGEDKDKDNGVRKPPLIMAMMTTTSIEAQINAE
eukprot:CAMPEP_0194756292 /NCGR_PEP_ID=MMETSP0323_2-20130528/10021_1 /TAXON_ID=2866 ORGANISM="Crypthecodinium cohnii, Strain Seligo" /NCGR_SAMPLE_ID=MMETSP0323_2 /ASSEMBLY_ACC=CAM_ASM_000346 /LENGTH=55 /DNA_ID=CAMNT_0039675735 /DNA_START=36 /DNA_END=203 /DNA_ORIENTATION=-